MAYKQNNRSSKRRRVLLPIILAVVMLAGVGVGLYYHNMKPTSITNTNVKAKTQAAYNAPNEARKNSSTPATTLDNGSTAPKTSSPAAFTVQIVSSNIDDNDTNLHVGTMVNNTTGGSCTLTASQTGQTTLQLGTSSVQQDVNSYDCGVFNIPTSKFPVSGSWQIKLSVTNNGSEASDTASVIITSS
jgi:hypothetical protein